MINFNEEEGGGVRGGGMDKKEGGGGEREKEEGGGRERKKEIDGEEWKFSQNIPLFKVFTFSVISVAYYPQIVVLTLYKQVHVFISRGSQIR